MSTLIQVPRVTSMLAVLAAPGGALTLQAGGFAGAASWA